MRPQTKSACASAVVNDPFVLIEPGNRRPDTLFLSRICQSTHHGFLGRKKIVVIQQIQDAHRLQDLKLGVAFLDKALHDGVDEVPVASIALHG